MKKILILLSLFICCKISFAQNPVGTDTLKVRQPVANAPTNILITNAFQAAGGVQFGYFLDTSMANGSSTKCKNYPNAMISTWQGAWQRNFTATRWIKITNNDNINAITGCYSLIRGGIVTWSGSGLIMDVSPADYAINCSYYHSIQSQVTLSAANPSLPRIDLIYVDTTSTVKVITGTPNSTPIKPQVDASYQLELTYILVPAGATTPSGVTQTIVYDENLGTPTEFNVTTSLSAGSVNFNSTNNPFHLTKNALIATSTSGYIYFTTSSPLTLSDYTTLKLYIRVDDGLPAGRIAYGAYFRLAGVPVSNTLPIESYGFDQSVTGSYQVITIPVSDFSGGFLGTTFDGVALKLTNPNGVTIHIDYVQLQGGIPTGSSPYLTNIFRKKGTDSVFQVRNGVPYFAFIDSTGGGGTVSDFYFRNTGTTGDSLLIPISSNTAGVKKLIAGTNVTFTIADSSITINASGGGGGSSPAGNFGNVQINRNSLFATPASDSLTFSGGLSVKGTGTFTGLVTVPTSGLRINATTVTSTGTQLNYLNAATGTTGTTSTNLVFSTSPLFTTPRLASTSTIGQLWKATDASGNGSFQDDTTYTYKNTLYNQGIVVFYDNFSRSSIGSNYVTAFPGTTATISSAGLRLVGTPGNYVNYISRLKYTASERFSEKITYINNTISSTAYGITVGMQSQNTFCCTHEVTAGVGQYTGSAILGKSFITGGDSYGFTSNGSSTISTISVGDTIDVTLVRDYLTYTVTSYNRTTGQTSTHSVVTTLGLSTSNFYVNNTSYPTLNFFGGDITVIGFEYRLLDSYNADYGFVGNSITTGQAATANSLTFPNLTFVNDAGIVQITNAGGGDYTQSVVNRLSEIYALNPRYVMLMIGGNDLLFGVSTATWEANLRTIRDSLVAHGIQVIHLYPTPRNSTDMTPLVNFLDTCTRFTTDTKVRATWDSLKTGTSLKAIYDAGDGTHLSDSGHHFAAIKIRAVIIPHQRTAIPTIPLSSLVASGYDLQNAVLTNHGWDTLQRSSSGGGGGSGTVTSFAATDGNGFDFTVTNSTTTPTLTATTTVTDKQVMLSNSGAISGSTKLTFDPASDANSLLALTTGDVWMKTRTNNSVSESGFIAGNSSSESAVLEMIGSTFGVTSFRNNAVITSTGSGGMIFSQLNASGDIKFVTTGSLTERMRILNGGNVGIGDASPASLFTVGSGDKFQVDGNGNIVKLNNVTTTFPSSNSAGVLTNNGSGTLTWAAASTPTLQQVLTAGSILTGSNTINAATFGLGITASSGVTLSSTFTGTGGTAISGVNSGTGSVFVGSGVDNNVFDGTVNPSSTNTVVNTLSLARNSSGTPANGIGNSIEFRNETSTTASQVSNQLISKWTDVTNASRTSEFSIAGVSGGTSATLFTLAGTGALRLNNYGSGTFTGTATKTLQVDASGNIIEGAIGGSTRLDQITSATTINDINNVNNNQAWRWNSLSGVGFSLLSNSTAGGGNDILLDVEVTGANSTSTITTYGALFQNTHTGTSSTNVAATFLASGGTNNYAIIVPSSAGIVGIGTSAPAASSILDVASTSKGFAPPRMTTTQKNAISSPVEGLIVYDVTLHKLCVYTGSAWEVITSL